MAKENFYHDKTLAESDFYKKAREQFLFEDICNKDTKRTVPWNEEIVPEMPRAKADGDGTRLIMVDISTGIARYAVDHDRLNLKFNIDKALAKFSSSPSALLNYLTTTLYKEVEEVREKTGNYTDDLRADGLEADLHSSLIAVGFNDPLDVLLFLYERNNGEKVCYVAAIKPRLKN